MAAKKKAAKKSPPRRKSPAKRAAAPRTPPRPQAQAKPSSQRPPILEKLAPAGEHLFRAAGELMAAATHALEALPKREEPRRIVAAGKKALQKIGDAATKGAAFARRQAKERVRREALNEIVESIDRTASRLKGPAAAALATVRDAVSGAASKVGAAASRRTQASRDARREGTRAAVKRELDSVSGDAESDSDESEE